MKHMTFIRFYISGVILLAALPGCQRLEGRLDEVSSRIEDIENSNIAALEKQLAAMGESLDKLGQADTELKDYIEKLQGTADALRKSVSDNDARISELEKNLDQAIRDAQNSDASIKGELEQQITAAKADVLEQLTAAKSAMESRLEQTESTITELQTKDAELEKKISDLKAYVDSGIDSAKDWASATFATLEQYSSIVSDIGGIRGSIEKLETSMASLENSLTREVKTAVDTAMEQIGDQVMSGTAAAVVDGFTDAVSSVRNELEGLVSRVATLENDVRLIKEEVDKIKKEISDINVSMGESLQSLAFASPDGRAVISYGRDEESGSVVPGEAVLRFEVCPAAMADALAVDWENCLGLKAVYTMTKTVVGESVELPLRSASASDGILTLTASGENLDEAFFTKEVSASLRLAASLGGVSVSSKYIPLVPRSDAGAGSGISIPDIYFKRYLVDRFDTDGDGEISEEEALAVKEIDVSSVRYICSLSGLEHFKNLEKLDCSGNNLTELDLTACEALKNLNCSNNALSALNVKSNTALKKLNVKGNREISLVDLRHNPALEDLNVSGLNISELDLTGITRLTSLDVTDNPKLLRVICPSQDWLIKVGAVNDMMLKYVDSTGENIFGGGVKIDEDYWACMNVGYSSDNLYGKTYSFSSAQSVCPNGWRTPTVSDLESLSAHYSSVTTVNGMEGRWFSGSKTYSSSVPAVFLPYQKGWSGGGYWSSTEYYYYIGNAFVLVLDSSGVGMCHSDRSDSWSVRCVKN